MSQTEAILTVTIRFISSDGLPVVIRDGQCITVDIENNIGEWGGMLFDVTPAQYRLLS